MNKYWLKEPEIHDFAAAADYLSLLFTEQEAVQMAARLKAAGTIVKKAKDILRASRLPLLSKENIHVKANLQKVKKGKKLSPVLLVRKNSELTIADGYHRICSIYYLSEDLQVPCRLV